MWIGDIIKMVANSKTVVSDKFNRADNAGGLGNAETGQAWAVLAKTYGIESNRAYVAAGSGASLAYVNSGLGDCEVEVTIPVVGGDNSGLAVRATNASNFIGIVADSTRWRLVRRQSSVNTRLITNSNAPTAGDILKIKCIGNQIEMFVNGVSVGIVTEAFNQSVTNHGLIAVSNDYTIRWDNFKVEAI